MSEPIPEQFGIPYIFGFNALTPPVIGGGLVLTELTLERKPEFKEKAQDGSGMTVSVTKPTPDQDMIDFDGKGQITDLEDFDDIGDTFTWNGRFFIIDSKTEPFKAGKYLVVGIKGESNKNVTGPAS